MPVKIKWEGPLSLQMARTRADVVEDYGLYQVYGRHVVFGADALLYIGRATEQTFAQRLTNHRWLDEEQDVTIRLGRIADDDYKSNAHWRKIVCDCESLSIYRHSPPYNSQNIQRCSVVGLHVQNWGARGALMQEFSSDWARLPIEE